MPIICYAMHYINIGVSRLTIAGMGRSKSDTVLFMFMLDNVKDQQQLNIATCNFVVESRLIYARSAAFSHVQCL